MSEYAPPSVPATAPAGASRRSIAEIVLAYALFASAWILFSDSLLAQLVRDPDAMMVASTVKGWVFVAVTSLLLYLLMRGLLRQAYPRARDLAPEAGKHPFARLAPVLLAGLGVASIAGASALLAYHQEAGKDFARLEAVARLKADQVAAWIEERYADAHFVHSSQHWARLFRGVREGDAASREQLLARMDEFRMHHRYGAILLLDPQGELVLAAGDFSAGTTPELRDAALKASASGRIRHSASRTVDSAQPVRLEFVAPLPAPPGEAPPLAVLVPDPTLSLFPLLANWPSPAEHPSILLARRDDAGAMWLPVAGPTRAGKVERAVQAGAVTFETAGGRVVAPVPVRGSDWIVVTSLERSALLAGSRMHALWIGLAGAFGLFALVASGFVHRQRQQLRFARLQQHEQAEKLQALSERISAEEALRASNEQKDRLARELERHRDHLEELVEERTRELGRMVANLETFNYTISHDLRAPLRAINGFASVLSAQEHQRLSPEGERLLERIRSGSERMDRLLNDILEYSRVDRAEPLRTPVDLRKLADETVREFAPGYPDAEVIVGALPTVQADATMMRQVFSNLIGNALKFSAARSTPRVEIGIREDGATPEIFVRDNGAGFDMRYASKLFKIFQRMHSDSEFPGTGVGLAIVKRLVEHHGGLVRAESTPGEGTTFYFSLCAAR